MSGWSNSGRFANRGRSSYNGGARKKLPSNYNDKYTIGRPMPREPGISLTPAEAQQLVAQALADSGLISPAEDFEHLLVLTEEWPYYHAYHFIVAPPRVLTEPRRAVMVSDRTVNMRNMLLGNDMGVDFARKLARYAKELDSPRLIIGNGGVAGMIGQYLHDRVSSNLRWLATEGLTRLTDRARFDEFTSQYAFGFTRYLEAREAGCIHHPDPYSIATQRNMVTVERDFTDALTIKRPDLALGRDMKAFSLLYAEEELRRVGATPLEYSGKVWAS